MILDADLCFPRSDFDADNVVYMGFCLRRGTLSSPRIYFGSAFHGVHARKCARFSKIRKTYAAIMHGGTCSYNLDGMEAYMMKYGYEKWHMIPFIQLHPIHGETGPSWTKRAETYEMFFALRV